MELAENITYVCIYIYHRDYVRILFLYSLLTTSKLNDSAPAWRFKVVTIQSPKRTITGAEHIGSHRARQAHWINCPTSVKSEIKRIWLQHGYWCIQSLGFQLN